MMKNFFRELNYINKKIKESAVIDKGYWRKQRIRHLLWFLKNVIKRKE